MTIEDLGSRNGTIVNGRRIAEVTPLPLGSVIVVGRTKLEIASVTFGFDMTLAVTENDFTSTGEILIPLERSSDERTAAYIVVDVEQFKV